MKVTHNNIMNPYQELEKKASRYVFDWIVITSGIYRTGCWADRFFRKEIETFKQEFADCLKKMNLRLADIPPGAGPNIDFLKLPAEQRIPRVEKLRNKFIKTKKTND